MRQLITSLLAAVCMVGLSGAALAAPMQPSVYSTVLAAKEVPAAEAGLQGKLTKLQDEIQMLQNQMQALNSREVPQGGLRCFFSVQPMPNLDGAPIPSGG